MLSVLARVYLIAGPKSIYVTHLGLRPMTSVARESFAAIAGVASLISGAFWLLSADAQVKALKLSGEASAALSKVAVTPTPTQEALVNAGRAAGEAANALTFLSVQHNLYAAVCAVVTGLILAGLAGTD